MTKQTLNRIFKKEFPEFKIDLPESKNKNSIKSPTSTHRDEVFERKWQALKKN